MSTTETALQQRDIIQCQTVEGRVFKYEVVSVVDNPQDSAQRYAVCYSKDNDTYVVTDLQGNLLEDDDLAQGILDEFIVLARECAPE